MKELGADSADWHRQAGHAIAALGNIDFLAGVTGDACHIVEGAVAGGMRRERACFFDSKPVAADWLADLLQPGDWALLKASRAVGLETIVETLNARFAEEAAGSLSERAVAGKRGE
jgi:UDP-N-acetylmuramyl pentapeptide synthase